MKEGLYYKKLSTGDVVCGLCPLGCVIPQSERGRCFARKNVGGELRADSYGKITGYGLDAIEKKPLYRFYPGSTIYSVGSFGCNLTCDFCQNYRIAQDMPSFQEKTPEAIVEEALEAKKLGNIGIAYTYNEPSIGIEIVLDTAVLARSVGLKNVLVTNGFLNREPFQDLCGTMDAMNIDLKGWTEDFYRSCGGSLAPVMRNIEYAAKTKGLHLELTTLVIPGHNDAPEEMENMATWIGALRKDIPLHLSRFFPAHRMKEVAMTPMETLVELESIAKRHLTYVYLGNV